MLPITRVVLYKHGVGYFERQGPVRDVTAIDLHFKASEMNDVLKSLTTLDLDSGIVSSISYESVKPIERQLDDVAVRLDDTHVVSRLVAQVKGARVAIDVAGRTIEGTVLGTEEIERRDGDVTTSTHRLALLVGGATVQSYDLLELRSISFSEESLRKDLQHLLDILISSKKKDLKKLTIYASGEGERRLFVSYIVEAPVWKTSYRLLLDEKGAPLLQGWALVDNTQDEDWENVRLSLVAGLPISFVHDLYAPRYKRRPTVEVKEEAAYAPPQLEGAVEEYETVTMAQAYRPGPPGMAPGAFAAPAPAAAFAAAPMTGAAMRQRMQASAPVQTRTVEVGDLFEYEIKNPVTVKRGQSALVPILQSKVEGKRVAVYNPEVRAKNPMSAVFFKNTTGSTLEGGPVTVLEDTSYVGESMLETIKPDEEKLVPFSVELGCVVTVDPQSELRNVSHSRIVSGYLYLTRYRMERRVYVVTNKSPRALDLFLDHRFTHGWELLESETDGKPVERTENFYRFRIEVPPNKTTRFTVTERGDQTETHALVQTSRDDVALWLQNRWIDEHIRQVLLSLIELQAQVADLARRIQQREASIAEIFHNQERVRANLQALGVSPDERGLRDRYVSELSFDEDRLKDLRDELRRDKQLKDSLEHDLRERLGSLAFQSAL
ncbi:MAG: hypothetical protein HOW73_11155 [Polyangiaceae bacterium]|nr:hypothetical protein [Polyangiaceae bacterium]